VHQLFVTLRRFILEKGLQKIEDLGAYDLYSSPEIIRVMKLRRTRCAIMEEKRMLRGWRKPEGKGPLGIPRRRWDDDINVYLKETG
jgi:hypothetical protein